MSIGEIMLHGNKQENGTGCDTSESRHQLDGPIGPLGVVGMNQKRNSWDYDSSIEGSQSSPNLGENYDITLIIITLVHQNRRFFQWLSIDVNARS